MDNISHSIAGLAFAELALRASGVSEKAAAKIRGPLWAASVLANNLPDLDFLMTPLTAGPLGYLLHHRGHTHTLVAALLQALLVLFGTFWWTRRRTEVKADGKYLFTAVIMLGPFLHLGMDWLNSYGVHPFWPFDNGWYYGDSVFIIEPWFWVSLAPALALIWSGRVLRFLLFLPPILAVALAIGSGIVPVPLITGLVGLAFLIVLVSLKRSRTAALILAAVVSLGVGGWLISSSSDVKEQVRAWHEREANGFALHDASINALPANPFCWTVVTVEFNVGEGIYRLRRGSFAPWPERFSRAGFCSGVQVGTAHLQLEPTAGSEDGRFSWEGRADFSLAELRRLAREHCGFAAYLQFSRAPFVVATDDGFVAGDLRFDFQGRGDFASVSFSHDPEPCPKNRPPWTPPTDGLLINVAGEEGT